MFHILTHIYLSVWFIILHRASFLYMILYYKYEDYACYHSALNMETNTVKLTHHNKMPSTKTENTGVDKLLRKSKDFGCFTHTISGFQLLYLLYCKVFIHLYSCFCYSSLKFCILLHL
jgi:hypothetical protein